MTVGYAIRLCWMVCGSGAKPAVCYPHCCPTRLRKTNSIDIARVSRAEHVINNPVLARERGRAWWRLSGGRKNVRVLHCNVSAGAAVMPQPCRIGTEPEYREPRLRCRQRATNTFADRQSRPPYRPDAPLIVGPRSNAAEVPGDRWPEF